MLGAEGEEDRGTVWNLEPVGLELPALARLDGDLRMRERDVVPRERQRAGEVPPDLRGVVEPGHRVLGEERVGDRQRHTVEREHGRDAEDANLGARLERLPNALLHRSRALVEDLDRHAFAALGFEESRQTTGPVVELWSRHERPTAADADDLVVVLEDRECLPDDHAAHAEDAGELGLGGKRVAGLPDARLDLLLQHLLKLIVQGDKAAAIELLEDLDDRL